MIQIIKYILLFVYTSLALIITYTANPWRKTKHRFLFLCKSNWLETCLVIVMISIYIRIVYFLRFWICGVTSYNNGTIKVFIVISQTKTTSCNTYRLYPTYIHNGNIIYRKLSNRIIIIIVVNQIIVITAIKNHNHCNNSKNNREYVRKKQYVYWKFEKKQKKKKSMSSRNNTIIQR